jgi:hypothetical protein
MNMETAGARTYEPDAFLPSTTCENAMLLLKFYQYTGDRKYLAHIPDAVRWLEKTKLPSGQVEDGYTHPTFVEKGTNKAIFVHRKGSNVKYGYYYVDYNDKHLLAHYNGKRNIPLDELKAEYTRLSSVSVEEATKDSPLKIDQYAGADTPQQFYFQNREAFDEIANETEANIIIQSIDNQDRWMIKHAFISNPYIGDGQNQVLTDNYATTRVGDETDTSPYSDPSDQLYISTGEYIRNMNILINYIKSKKLPIGNHK